MADALVLYPYEDARSVERAWRDYARSAPDTVAPEIGLWSIPPLPDVPVELHGAPVVFVPGVYIGQPSEAAPVLAPLQRLGTVLADMSGTGPYVESQRALDELSDEMIDGLVALDTGRPSPQSMIFVRTLGGAIGTAEESVYPHRSARFNVSVDASWFDPDLDDTPSPGPEAPGTPWLGSQQAGSTSTSPGWRRHGTCAPPPSGRTRTGSTASERSTTDRDVRGGPHRP